MNNQTFTEIFKNIQNSIEELFNQYQWLNDKEHVLFTYSSQINENLTKSLIQKFFPEQTEFNKNKLQFILNNNFYFICHLQSILKNHTQNVRIPYSIENFIIRQYVDNLDKLHNWNTEEFKEQ